MGRSFWDPSKGLHGMFDLWSFSDIDAVVSAGLGGGSLIYANVMIRKDEHWFVQEDPRSGPGYEYWPVNREQLDPDYDIAERMLGATAFPVRVGAVFDGTQDAGDEVGRERRSSRRPS